METVTEFLVAAAGVTTADPRQLVSLKAMLERIGYVAGPGPGPGELDWTYEGLLIKHGEYGTDMIRFGAVPSVLMRLIFAKLPAPWDAGMLAFNQEIIRSLKATPVPEAAIEWVWGECSMMEGWLALVTARGLSAPQEG